MQAPSGSSQAKYTAPVLFEEVFEEVTNSADDPVRREGPYSRRRISIDKVFDTWDPEWEEDARPRQSGLRAPSIWWRNATGC